MKPRPRELLPIELGVIECDGIVLHPTRPIRLGVTVDRTGRLYVIEEPALGLHAYVFPRGADTQADLLGEVEDQLRFLWRRYAKAPKEELAPDALALAARLRSAFEEREP